MKTYRNEGDYSNLKLELITLLEKESAKKEKIKAGIEEFA